MQKANRIAYHAGSKLYKRNGKLKGGKTKFSDQKNGCMTRPALRSPPQQAYHGTVFHEMVCSSDKQQGGVNNTNDTGGHKPHCIAHSSSSKRTGDLLHTFRLLGKPFCTMRQDQPPRVSRQRPQVSVHYMPLGIIPSSCSITELPRTPLDTKSIAVWFQQGSERSWR